MKYLIIGHGRHGKDTLADLFRTQAGLKCKSSSEFACEKIVYPTLKKKYGYSSPTECWKDRITKRKEWYALISSYNTPEKWRLPYELLKENDVYVGLRSREELFAAKERHLFDLIIWVDASERLPLEKKESFDVLKTDADIIIENNRTEEEFIHKATRLIRLIK